MVTRKKLQCLRNLAQSATAGRAKESREVQDGQRKGSGTKLRVRMDSPGLSGHDGEGFSHQSCLPSAVQALIPTEIPI